MQISSIEYNRQTAFRALIRSEAAFLRTREDLREERKRFFAEVVNVCAPCNKFDVPNQLIPSRKIYEVCPTCPVWEKKQQIFADLARMREVYIMQKRKVKFYSTICRILEERNAKRETRA